MFHPELKWQNNFQIKFLFLSVVSRKSVLSLIKFYPNLILLAQDDNKNVSVNFIKNIWII